MTFPAAKGTVLAKVDTDTGEVIRSRLIRHRFSVPLVAYDLSAGGLAADGKRSCSLSPAVRSRGQTRRSPSSRRGT